MKLRHLAVAALGAAAIGVAVSPAASAAPTWTYPPSPCSDDFAQPWELEAWSGSNYVALSPYGTADLSCGAGPKGGTYVYQLDADGRSHILGGGIPVFTTRIYWWAG